MWFSLLADSMANTQIPTLDDIRDAAARIAPYAQTTPVWRSHSLDALAGCELHFKCENLQRVGAFKFRGACNTVWSLDAATAARGVVTHSSGNHGAALALAARTRGVKAWVVAPNNTPKIKLDGIRAYGGELSLCEPSMAAREAAAARLRDESGAELVHPFDDSRVIAGQGTAALELLGAVPGLDALLTPVGGGGLLSGTAIAARALAPRIELYGAEPTGAADAQASLREGRCITDRRADTICDGLRGHLSALTFGILRDTQVQILDADDVAIAAAMRLLWERLKLVIEPSGAVPLATILRFPQRFRGRRVGVILSGGNVDLDALPWRSSSSGPHS